jgi:hypothetical protein
MGIKMTEHEAILLDMLLRDSKTNPPYDGTNSQIDALLRTVRATALRDAAKSLVDNQHGTQNWLFDRADYIETGKA